MGSDVLFVMQTCLMAFLRRSPYCESLEMTIPRRGRIGPMGGVEELLCLVGLLNLTFFIPMRLLMSKRETIFFDSSRVHATVVEWACLDSAIACWFR